MRNLPAIGGATSSSLKQGKGHSIRLSSAGTEERMSGDYCNEVDRSISRRGITLVVGRNISDFISLRSAGGGGSAANGPTDASPDLEI
jgi:hypothetical protein